MAEAEAPAGVITNTTILEVLVFSGDKETTEYGVKKKYIGAAFLLREMVSSRAANPNWKDEAALGHCVRSFSNNVAVWWVGAIYQQTTVQKSSKP
jgi:hypothetical protein